MSYYINPFVDYGFKKLFATEANKDLMIGFLNAILDDTGDPVVDLVYKNVEQIGEFNGTRANYFDVYCETETGRKFIVEMQNTWKPFFKDRTLYYIAKPIRDQGLKEVADSVKGYEVRIDPEEFKSASKKKPKWNFRLNEVCLISVMNFTFPKREYKEDEYFHKVMLSDVDDHHVFYDKLSLYYIEMPKLDNVKLKLDTPREKWIYALYHLWRYDIYPEELKDDIFRKFYHEADYANYDMDEQLAYERSCKVYLDTYNEIEGGRILGREEGYQLGFEKGVNSGREEGQRQLATEIARKMKAAGMDPAVIAEITGVKNL